MYRIKVRNDQTGFIWYEYGFSHWIVKRINFLFNEVDSEGYHIYDILDITSIVFTFSTFKKCLFNKTQIKLNEG